MRRRSATVSTLVLGLVLAVGAAYGATPTKAQFIRQGDHLCGRAQRELQPLRRQAEAARSLPVAQQWVAVTEIWTAQVRIQSRFNARFRALGVPAGDATARSLVSGLDRGLVLARRVRDAFAERDTASLEMALPAYVRFTSWLNRRVARYGFTVCGR